MAMKSAVTMKSAVSMEKPDGIPYENVMQGSYYDADRERVRMLRMGGAVTEQIAVETGLTEDKVRGYLRELALPEIGCCFSGNGAAVLEHWYRGACVGDPTVQLCEQCGKPIPRSSRGRRRRFCSDTCRSDYWNEKAREERIGKPTVCKNCGREFSPQTGKKQKYCCQACYLAARYGKQNVENEGEQDD